MEQLDYNLLFRSFVGLGLNDAARNHSVFSKNRERLLNEKLADAFFRRYGFGPARNYWLARGDRQYPSKAIFGAAFQIQFRNDDRSRLSRLRGGEQNVVAWLRGLGYKAIETDSVAPNTATLSPPARSPWTWEDLVRVCGFYFTLPFGRIQERNPEIVRIAIALGRTPASVAMKLSNLASLDPEITGSGRSGLTGASRLDRQVWEQFQQERERMVALSEEWLESLGEDPGREIPELLVPEGPTETEATVKVRRMQNYFRRMILGIYEGRCCVTGLPLEELLVASHILPWARYPELRLDRGNGLCLAAHFDRAFDRGLIAFDEQYRLLIGKRLRTYSENSVVRSEFLLREGKPLLFFGDAKPSIDLLQRHRTELFER